MVFKPSFGGVVCSPSEPRPSSFIAPRMWMWKSGGPLGCVPVQTTRQQQTEQELLAGAFLRLLLMPAPKTKNVHTTLLLIPLLQLTVYGEGRTADPRSTCASKYSICTAATNGTRRWSGPSATLNEKPDEQTIHPLAERGGFYLTMLTSSALATFLQVPKPAAGMGTAQSPTASRVTPDPTAVISPTPSLPPTAGKSGRTPYEPSTCGLLASDLT